MVRSRKASLEHWNAVCVLTDAGLADACGGSGPCKGAHGPVHKYDAKSLLCDAGYDDVASTIDNYADGQKERRSQRIVAVDRAAIGVTDRPAA